MERRTTVQIPKALREELKGMKKTQRETYEEVIKRIIKNSRKELK